jgi:hypothetical protein
VLTFVNSSWEFFIPWWLHPSAERVFPWPLAFVCMIPILGGYSFNRDYPYVIKLFKFYLKKIIEI